MVRGSTSRPTAPANSYRYCNNTGRITVNDLALHRNHQRGDVTRLAVEARWDVLIGRRRELEMLAEMLGEVRLGYSRVLVVRGEAGVGKTALLNQAVAHVADLHVTHVSGA